MGAYFCIGAYKRDVVVVIKMGAHNHGVLILCGCLLSRFYGIAESLVFHEGLSFKYGREFIHCGLSLFILV